VGRLRSSTIQAALLAKVPVWASRIKVKDEKGQGVYRTREEILDSDEIQTKKDGTPIVMRSAPGRRKDPVLTPATPIVAAIMKRRAETIQVDPILEVARRDPESSDLLQQVVLAVGEEAASLKFEREEAERAGQDPSNISVKRISALKTLSDTWLRRKEQIASRDLDLQSPGFKSVFRFILETIQEAMNGSGMSAEMIETVMAKAAQMFNDDWDNEAKNRLKNVS